MVAVEHPGLATAVLDRDEVGRVTRATAGDLIHEWGYSGGFITSHSATGGGRHGTATMEYNDDGQLTSVTIDGAQTRYRYDDAAQMVEATTPTGVNTWTYDLAGRLVTEQVDGITWERTYNAAGQLLKAASGEATITYTYDHSGRRTTEKHSDGSRRDFEWTGLWRLAAITDHHGDQVHRTTTVVDALGQLSRVDNEQLFFDHVDGGPLQVGDDAIITAGPLTARQSTGWLQPSWRPDRDTQPHNPYLPPIAQASLGAGIDLGPRGEIHIAGMEWLGARILDPNSRGFLSPDPPTTDHRNCLGRQPLQLRRQQPRQSPRPLWSPTPHHRTTRRLPQSQLPQVGHRAGHRRRRSPDDLRRPRRHRGRDRDRRRTRRR